MDTKGKHTDHANPSVGGRPAGDIISNISFFKSLEFVEFYTFHIFHIREGHNGETR